MKKYHIYLFPHLLLTGPHGNELLPATMEVVLNFIYTETINLSPDIIFNIIMAADYLDVKHLKVIKPLLIFRSKFY